MKRKIENRRECIFFESADELAGYWTNIAANAKDPKMKQALFDYAKDIHESGVKEMKTWTHQK